MCLEIISNVQKIATVLLASKILDNPSQLLHKYMIINKRHVNAEMSSEVEAKRLYTMVNTFGYKITYTSLYSLWSGMWISKINSEKKTWFQPRVNRIKYILAFVWITCMTSRASRHLSPRLRHVTNTKLCFAFGVGFPGRISLLKWWLFLYEGWTYVKCSTPKAQCFIGLRAYVIYVSFSF